VIVDGQADPHAGVSDTTIRQLVEAALLGNHQVVPWAPWEIQRADADTDPVRSTLSRGGIICYSEKSRFQAPQPGLFHRVVHARAGRWISKRYHEPLDSACLPGCKPLKSPALYRQAVACAIAPASMTPVMCWSCRLSHHYLWCT